MKNLKLSELENISGGNALYSGNSWETAGKYIFCTVITLGSFVLQFLAIRMLSKYPTEAELVTKHPPFNPNSSIS